eukprot:4585145-Amphidinium_carterae.2
MGLGRAEEAHVACIAFNSRNLCNCISMSCCTAGNCLVAGLTCQARLALPLVLLHKLRVRLKSSNQGHAKANEVAYDTKSLRAFQCSSKAVTKARCTSFCQDN